MGIDVRKAVVATIDYMESFKDMMGSGFEDLRLEEVERSKDKQYWLITLGFTLPRDKNTTQSESIVTLISQSKPPLERNYKLFNVNAETGEVESMKIRKL